MPAPTIGTFSVVASDSRMAPAPTTFYVDVDADGSTWATGSGEWQKGRWIFQLIDLATNTIYTSTNGTFTCKGGSSVTAEMWCRVSATMHFGVVINDAGRYRARCMFQNEGGLFSLWAYSEVVVVAPGEPGTDRPVLWVDGTLGDDAGAGTEGDPLLTYTEALLQAVDDTVIILKDDTNVDADQLSDLDVSGIRNLWTKRSGDGTNPANLVLKGSGYAAIFGDGAVYQDCPPTFDGSTRRNFARWGADAKNIAFRFIPVGEISSFLEVSSGVACDGVILQDVDTTTEIQRYMLFSDSMKRLSILNCSWVHNSADEHLLRAPWTEQNGGTPPRISNDLAVEWTEIDQNNLHDGKTCARIYVERNLGLYRSRFAGAKFEIGNLDAQKDENETYTRYRADCCIFDFDGGATSDNGQFILYEGLSEVFMAACVIHQSKVSNLPLVKFGNRGGPAPGLTTITNVVFRLCSLYNSGNTSTSSTPSCLTFQTLTLDATGIVFDGCMIQVADAHVNANNSLELLELQTGPPAGVAVTNSVLYSDHPTYAVDVASEEDGTTYDDASDLNAQPFGSGNIDGEHTISNATGEVTGGSDAWKTNAADIAGVFESINGEVLDRNAGAWAASAWHPVGSGTGQAAGAITEQPTLLRKPLAIATAAGVLRIWRDD